MIRIHRSRPVAQVGLTRIRLSRAEHSLLTTLGMMDNKLVPADLLIEMTLESPSSVPADIHVLYSRIYRLRQKIGPDRIQRRPLGYILVDEVHFVE